MITNSGADTLGTSDLLSPNGFLILGVLLDGRPRLPDEIKKQTGLKLDQWNHLRKTLLRDARIEAGTVLARRNAMITPRSAYSITEAGRQLWMETLDWFTVFGARYGLSTKSREHGTETTILSRRPPAKADRLPTAVELSRVLQNTSRSFGLLLLFSLHTRTRITHAATLRIEDVDLAKPRLIVRQKFRRSSQRQPVDLPSPRVIRMDGVTRDILKAATGERKAGFVFRTCLQLPWADSDFGRNFRVAKTKAGLPSNVTFSVRILESCQTASSVTSAHIQQLPTKCRLPTNGETKLLLTKMPPLAAAVYQSTRYLPDVPLQAITGLDVGDVDLEKHRLRLRIDGAECWQSIPMQLHSLLSESIGKRSSGPVFLTQHRRRFHPQRLTLPFAMARRLTGLPRHIALRAD